MTARARWMPRSAMQSFSLSLLSRLPFADAASDALPLDRLLRLGLFQISVGMAQALIVGALNRVMIVELGIAASLVSVLVSLPLLLAPARALIGLRSDTHRSAFGVRRVPYIWRGTMFQFFGFALLPFALLTVTGQGTTDLSAIGWLVAYTAFALVGLGVHMTQTAGLALATDLATEETRPRVVALLWVLLLFGMLIGALGFGVALRDYSHTKLVQLVQGAGLLTLLCNVIALWKQEPRNRERAAAPPVEVPFWRAWEEYQRDRRALRLLVVTGLGAFGFSMQDVLLEPYGGQVLGLSVSQTTLLTAIMAAGSLAAFAAAARLLRDGLDPIRLAAMGAVTGLFAFAGVILSQPLASVGLFRAGVALIGLGGGLFAVGTLTAAMERTDGERNGMALGAWGAVQASCAGTAMLLGGVVRDLLLQARVSETLGPGVTDDAAGYLAVYQLELVFLVAAIVVMGPLAAPTARRLSAPARPFGLADLPG